MKPARLVLARICIDTDGRYSVDMAMDDRDHRGYGTVQVGEGHLAETLRYLEASLRRGHDAHKDDARRFQERRDAAWR